MSLVPILLLLLHPAVFYAAMNGILRRRGKPEITRSLGFGTLAGLLLWNVLGLIWQSLAIWVLTAQPLGLEFTKWWVVAGAYSLAWCARLSGGWACRAGSAYASWSSSPRCSSSCPTASVNISETRLPCSGFLLFSACSFVSGQLLEK